MEVPEQIALLVNPLANKKKSDKIVSDISSELSRKNISFSTFADDWPQQINNYKEAWIIGGDGTLNYFLNLYNGIDIPVAIFKGGTGNDFATKLYGNASIKEQVNKIINAEVKSVDAAACNGRIFINGLGIGFDGEVLKSINAIRLLGGHLGYLWIVLKKIFSYKEKEFQIKYDDEILTEKLLLVMITNSTTTGGGFLVSPEAEINDGKLNMILCKPLPIIKRLRNLPLIEKGRHLAKPFIIHKEIEKITINCAEETLAQIDGELIRATSFEINISPKSYHFKY